MNVNDKIKFVELMTGMGELFDKKLSKLLMKIYFESLKPYSIVDFEKAVNKIIVKSKWFPKPVELIELMQGNCHSPIYVKNGRDGLKRIEPKIDNAGSHAPAYPG